MEMKIKSSEKRLCTCCMEEHEVKRVSVSEQVTFKKVMVSYEALYLYCDEVEEFYMDEELLQKNDVRMKDAYRRKEGLLTSAEICRIRAKYGITQNDLCALLGWGGKTITRYEGHQVQDRAHDSIMRKLDKDPEWFLSLLEEARKDLKEEAYQKYLKIATERYEEERDELKARLDIALAEAEKWKRIALGRV